MLLADGLLAQPTRGLLSMSLHVGTRLQRIFGGIQLLYIVARKVVRVAWTCFALVVAGSMYVDTLYFFATGWDAAVLFADRDRANATIT